MVVLNFGHPLTDAQRAAIASLCGAPVERVIDAPAQFDPDRPFAGQAAELLDGLPLAGADWQTLPLVVNLPGSAPIAAVVLAELHGRCGYFPAVVRLRPVASTPVRYEVAEVIDLQSVRDAARKRR
jgi:hypothetical protein